MKAGAGVGPTPRYPTAWAMYLGGYTGEYTHKLEGRGKTGVESGALVLVPFQTYMSNFPSAPIYARGLHLGKSASVAGGSLLWGVGEIT